MFTTFSRTNGFGVHGVVTQLMVQTFPVVCSRLTDQSPRRAALILGIQYLTFQAFPIIFEEGHHFNVQSTGLSFLGMGIGLLLGLACQPIINMFV